MKRVPAVPAPPRPPAVEISWLAVSLLAAALAACESGTGPPATGTGAVLSPPASVPLPAVADEAALLDAVFRIDVERIEVTFDVYPGESRVEAHAAMTFRMRPGQTLPLVHFDPVRSATGVSMRLDGEDLDLHSGGDLRLISFDGSGQTSVELERTLAPASDHRLEVAYPLALSDATGRFYTNVNDLEGHGNETLFPSINSPRDLARHVLVFHVHAAEPYLAVGSGSVTGRRVGDVQEWVLDTEREVASYTVMFHLAPARSTLLTERRIHDVDVRVLAPVGGATAGEAFAQLDPWLAELESALGPFPMPRGLAVVLTQTGGGMEYYGATTTSLRALRHEVFHMYFGCSTVARTYRDSWWDEAINMWYELSADPAFAPIPEEFRSDIVSGRSPVAVGFDRRAYDAGARIFQAVASDLGGRERMVRFLRDLHARRSFDPFGTPDLADEIAAWGGVPFRARFRSWLYSTPQVPPTPSPEPGTTGRAAPGAAGPYDWLHHVDMTPPSLGGRE
jgi:aminopeptidase N